jgi:phage replication-related protein YjqB (UPF0714/DUF867 family)
VRETATVEGSIGIMAFHAGLEAGTLEVAAAAAGASGSSLYTVCQPASLRWHVASAEVDPAGSPALTEWLAHVTRAIAVHGYGRRQRPWDVLVGGAERDLAREVAVELRRSVPELRIVDDLDDIPAGLRGRHPHNPVNRPREGGVQIELPIRARIGPIAADVAAALATVARKWQAGS